MPGFPFNAELANSVEPVNSPLFGTDRSRIKLGQKLFWISVALFLLPGLVHAYLLMPFPGSQNIEAISVCYYLEKTILPLRWVGAALLAFHVFFAVSANTKTKIIQALVLLFCGITYYFTDVKYSAVSMFKEPQKPRFANALNNKVPQNYTVVGIVHNGVAKAYPIVYLGYHHKIQDDVANLPVLVTYCTMCRTGRVFSPVINGKRETFRLVGARHYNAVIEDATTKTWWYQATGEAAVGDQKGNKLSEIPYQQSSLAAWLQKYPASLILQPEEQFKGEYAELKKYDITQPVDRDSTIANKDSLLRKSWVVGLVANNQAKAYDWRKLAKATLTNDYVGHTPVFVNIENDKQTFNAWNRTINGKELSFKMSQDNLKDDQTSSVWNRDGLCVSGPYKGNQLTRIQAYQEYWHSWKNFHPATLYSANF